MPSQQPRRVRSKRWCFTLNNYTEEEELMLRSLVDQSKLTYIVFGKEVGDSGTPHLQGYCETNSRCGLRKMKNLIGARAHLEKANGSFESNKTYCTKEDSDAFEAGSPMCQGRRSDLDEIKTQLDGGATEVEIADQHFSRWVIYRKSFAAYVSLKQTPRNWKTKVVCLWGATGTGKTRFCYDQVHDQAVWSPGDFQWFDGYRGQEIVILDDYRGEYPIQLFLKLCDRYPMQVPIKGSFVNWRPKKIYITSNVNPNLWYDCDGSTFQAFKRRFDTIHNIQDPIYEDIVLFQ